ncbi:MAG: ribonuclease D [Alphaproteobacteria bacterium]
MLKKFERASTIMAIITNNLDLAAYIQQLEEEMVTAPWLAIDTEFMRDSTYYPQLCLIQLASKQSEAVVDPLSPNLDLTPLLDFLYQPHITKIFHAARQDLEIFYMLQASGKDMSQGHIPPNVFDTQLAAMACGLPENSSFDTLVQKFCGHGVNKSSRFTDWAKRPLSEAQLEYALNDVLFLRPVYIQLMQQLQENSRLPQVMHEIETNLYQVDYHIKPENAWKKLKPKNNKPEFIGVLQAVAAWRETEAQQLNIPRQRVLKDDLLQEIALQQPDNSGAVKTMRGLQHLSSPQAEAIATMVREGLQNKGNVVHEKHKSLTPNQATLAEMLRLLLKIIADEHKIVPRMIASNDEINQLACGHKPERLMEGWHYDIFTRHAEDFLSGDLSIGIANNKPSLSKKLALCP